MLEIEDNIPGQRQAKNNPQAGNAHLLLLGNYPLQTSDGYRYNQVLHLTTDFSGEQIAINLSRGKG
jgi:hypothetical protein